MNWWRQLRPWQWGGIIFTAAHLILVGILFVVLQGEDTLIIAFMDLPVVPIADKLFGKLYYNSTIFPVAYHLLIGSLLYGLVGAIVGWFWGLITFKDAG